MDTTDHLVVGLLNESFGWVDYLEVEGAKNSGRIHAAIFDMLKKAGLEAKDLSGIFQNSGPGSYTGMRVSEGIAQIFEWEQIPVYSFLHFEVPSFLGIESGKWLGKAFKGEFFISTWDKGNEEKVLVDLASAKMAIKGQRVFCHFKKSLEKDFAEELSSFEETGELIKNEGAKIFSLVLAKARRLSPYYFRTIDQEFKVPR